MTNMQIGEGKRRIDSWAESTVAKIRTVVPALWGAVIGQVLAWLIERGVVSEVAASWQGAIYSATSVAATGLSVWAVYSFARWVQQRGSRLSRLVARLLLVVLKEPSYVEHEA